MSQEVLEMMVKEIDLESVELQLALQCAPVLAGLKIANLLCVDSSMKETIIQIFEETDLSMYCLLEYKNKMTVLLYQEDLLKLYLQEKEVKKVLQDMGYQEGDVKALLTQLAERYQRYMEEKSDFPHEMGVFLGYPIEDVSGFITKQGKDFLCSGYWKVYQHAEAKQKLFQSFEHVKELMIMLLSCGENIQEIIEILREQYTYKKAI